MSTELTQMPNEFCPAGCPCYVPDIKSSNFFRIDGSCDYSVHVLGCEHEQVCEMWVKKLEMTGGQINASK